MSDLCNIFKIGKRIYRAEIVRALVPKLLMHHIVEHSVVQI